MDASGIYVSAGPRDDFELDLYRIPLAGGPALRITHGQIAVQLAVDDGYVYWLNGRGNVHSIRRVHKPS